MPFILTNSFITSLFEADINPVYRLLEENYLGKDAPNLNKAFFDIDSSLCFELNSNYIIMDYYAS